jgi:predicted PurR-regulated permease PerM
MIPIKEKSPVFARTFYIIAGLFLLIAMAYIGRSILVPLVFAVIIAILLHPMVMFFTRIGINRLIAIALALLISFIVLAALTILMFSQISKFGESLPLLLERITEVMNNSISWAAGKFDIKELRLHDWVIKMKVELLNTGSLAIGQTLATVGNGLVVILLVPVYIFMILYYQPIIIEFLKRAFSANNQDQLSEVVSQVKTLIQRYLIGLIIEAVAVATMYTITLLILGIEYAFLLGIIGALLNIIPYLGGLVGVVLPMMVALATKDSAWYALYVMGGYYFIQLIDNNYIVPKIVASKVKLNALFSIIVVIAGNALWGIPGMFLSIPMLAIVKLVFDNVDSFKPYGFLLGDTMPPLLKIKPFFKRKKKIQLEV